MNRLIHIFLPIMLACATITYASSERIYTSDTYSHIAIATSQDSFLIACPAYHDDVMYPRLYAACELKHVADSFYSIRSDRYAGFRDARITIEDDSTLNGHTRVIIHALNLSDIFYISRYTRTVSPETGQHIKNGVWIQDFVPVSARYAAGSRNLFDGIVIRPPCDYIRSNEFNDRYFGQLEYRFMLPVPIDLRTGNRCVTITFPNLDDSAFSLFYLNEIIIMTDNYLKWNDDVYFRSHLNDYSEWLDSLGKEDRQH